ncbi:MAG: hypothetical protein QM802_20515 [Agriterribacter sp.]
MLYILHQYLIQNKSLSLPGLGTLEIQNIPAISNFSDHVIEPPIHKIIFDDTQDAPSKTLFKYIATKLGLEEWEAIKKVNDFSYELKNHLKQGKEMEWFDAGILRQDASGNIILDSKPISYPFMQKVPAIRVIRSDASHTILRGDTEVSGNFIKPADAFEENTRTALFRKWWFWAITFAAIALLLIFFYYYNNGFKFSEFFNTEKAPLKEASPTYK